MLGLPNDQLALIVSAASFFTAFLSFLASARYTRDNFASLEINTFLTIIRESELYAEEIISASDERIKKARLARYANYMETLALLVRKRRFSSLVRRETLYLLLHFIVIFRHEGILDELYRESMALNELSYDNLRWVEKKHATQLGILSKSLLSPQPAEGDGDVT